MAGLLPLIGRGALTGAAAGLVAGGVGWLLAEPVIDRAIEVEAAHAVAEGHEAAVEVFTRDTQHMGLLAGWTIIGLSVGVLFAVVYAIVYRRDWATDAWRKSLWLAAAGFAGAMLLPFLRYPANPPGVGDPETIVMRTVAKTAAIAIGLAVMTAAWQLNGWLSRRGTGEAARHLAVAGAVIAGTALLWVLPANPDPVNAAAEPIYAFRMLSLLTTATLFGLVGVGFGLFGLRTQPAAAAAPSTTPA
jgi:hypothetical protein